MPFDQDVNRIAKSFADRRRRLETAILGSCHYIFCHFRFTVFVTERIRALTKLQPLILLFVLLGISAVNIEGANWRGIRPLHSTREQVRTTLGKPVSETIDRMEFQHREGRVVVFFYTTADTASLKLAPALAGRVLTLYLYPKKPRRFDRVELGRRIGKVGRGMTIEGEPMMSFDDGEKGISYHFKGDSSKVWRIAYYGPRVEFERYKIEKGPPKHEHDHQPSAGLF